ncbi:MAG: hypothetical protein JW703_00780, partial [Candidatus Diapherotrites archaeon]|nr:hypothetical protein [Candidatus Diapherotrites archaeon]
RGLKLFDDDSQEEPQGIDLSGTKLILPVLGVLVLLIIGFFAYSYFIGDIKEIEFRGKDLSGKNISNFTVKISNEQGEIIATAKEGEKISLRKGNYTARIIASGYKTEIQSIAVTRNDSFSFELTADIDASFGNIQGLNEIVLAGETINAKIIINSNSSLQADATISFSGDFKNVFEKNSVEDKKITLKPGSNEIEVELKVKTKTSLSRYMNKDLIGVLSLKENPEITKNYSFKAGVLSENDLSFSETKLDFDKINAGESSSKTIIASNKNALVNFEKINLTLQITSSGTTSEEEILSWIELNPESIESLEANERSTKQIELKVTLPYDAPTERITGKIIASFKLMSEQKEKEIKFEFDSVEAEVGIELQEFPSGTIEITKEDSETVFPLTSFDFFIANTGELRLQNISITRKCEPYEANNWINLSKDFLESIEAQEKQKITLRVNANTDEEQTIPCWIYISYLNPASTEKENIEKSFSIRLKSIAAPAEPET